MSEYVSRKREMELAGQEMAEKAFARHNQEKTKKSRSKKKDFHEIMNLFSRGLLFQTKFIREPSDWKSKSHNVDKQKQSFINWVYRKYPVPDFMYEVFTKDEPVGVPEHLNWFLTITQGGSFAKCQNLLTKKEAHLFLNAPDDNSINENLWWVKCKALDINDKMTNAVAKRFFINIPVTSVFWLSLLTLIKNEENVEVSVVSDVMDFLRAQMRRGTFSLKGRTFGSLIKLSNKWHREMQLKRFGDQNLTWPPFNIPDWKFKSKQTKIVWSVNQLLSSKELWSEGRRMRHCVASYGHRCVGGASAIFTMVSDDGINADEKHLTIEININKQLVQVRGRMNKPPSGMAHLMLKKWMNVHGITDSQRYW